MNKFHILKKLNERKFLIGDYECQRDLYSAFFLKCYKTKDEIETELYFKKFERVKELYKIESIGLGNQTNINCILY